MIIPFKPRANIAAVSSAAMLKEIAIEAGAGIAKELVAGILDGNIHEQNAEAAAKKLSGFVLGVCLAMKADGQSSDDIELVREMCIHGFRVGLAAFRFGMASSERSTQ